MRFRSTVLKLAYPLIKRWWAIRKPYFRVVRVVVRHESEILLVRHAYGAAAWGIPGGGVKKGEDPLEAAVRETREETGIRLFRIEGIPDNPLPAKDENGELWVFVADAISREHRVDGVEIMDSRWCQEENFPTEILNQARYALEAAGIRTA